MESILIILFGIGICALYIWVGRQFVSQSRTPMGNVIYRSTTGSQNIDLKKRRTLYLLYQTSGLVTLIWSLLSVVIALKFNVFLGFISTFFSFGIPSIFLITGTIGLKKKNMIIYIIVVPTIVSATIIFSSLLIAHKSGFWDLEVTISMNRITMHSSLPISLDKDSIRSVRILDDIGGRIRKDWGFDGFNARIGYFSTDKFGRIYIHSLSNKPPYIYIETYTDKQYLVNRKCEEETFNLYREIKHSLR